MHLRGSLPGIGPVDAAVFVAAVVHADVLGDGLRIADAGDDAVGDAAASDPEVPDVEGAQGADVFDDATVEYDQIRTPQLVVCRDGKAEPVDVSPLSGYDLQTRALLEGKPKPPAPPVEERFAIALDHARMAQEYEADPRGAAIEFRKHLGWYVKGLPGSADLRKALHAVNSLGEVEGIFGEYLANRERYLERG